MRDAAAIVRARLRQTMGLPAVITYSSGGTSAPITVTLGSNVNEAAAQASFAIERDRRDVLVAAADYGQEPVIGDKIAVTMPDQSTMQLAVYVPDSAKQCYQNSGLFNTELRVFCKQEPTN